MSVPRETGLGVDAELRYKLNAFAEVLRLWNRTVNLVARADVPHIWDRHIADSLQLADLVAPGVPFGIDLGSGAGFPGLILSLATGIPFTLIEADHRKCAFLREAARVTCAMVEVRAIRMELVTNMQAPVVTARGLGSLPSLLPTLQRLVAPGGMALLPRGTGASADLDAAPEWSMIVKRHASRTRAGSEILELQGIRRVA